ncbi:phage major capsid protein [Paenactinomyces guangxiensis]|uniref:Phage major capsid protein n=1 Tax=Paenactinomyces guangxiensis TaxID=1490290 RepID=A0A7W1WSE3_9BACL|nr:phage major capsid protein [Paenactinomyces guangxiensis]MBA4495104.1 phage major capsid protein [Paenactinomyces guangxiensis]MBH8592212.1 phage major capsid protein [Paenactinomyces guangxiensis]
MDLNNVKQVMERIDSLEKEVNRYKAEEKARAAMKKAEAEAEAKAKEIVNQELEEKQLVEEFFQKMLQEKTKEERRRKKLEFPVTDRAGNLSKTDKALVDICMGRKTMNVRNVNQKAAITFTTSNADDWAMTELAREIIRAKTDLVTVRNFLNVIDMPSNPYRIPLRTGRANTFYVSQNANVGQNETDFISDMTLTAAKLGSYVPLTTEAEEDSLIPVIGEIRQAIAEGAAAEEENAVIAGKWYGASATGTDITEFDGLLEVAGVTQDFGAIAAGSEYTGGLEFISKLRGKMGPYGINPNQLALVIGPEIWAWMIDQEPVRTLDKYGNQATILTGEVGKVYGIPIFVTTCPDMKVDNTGTGTENDAHKVLLVNRMIPRMGDRRTLTLKTDQNIKQDTIDIVGTERVALQTPASTDGNMRKGIAVGTVYMELDS